jgi:hypothetical protein
LDNSVNATATATATAETEGASMNRFLKAFGLSALVVLASLSVGSRDAAAASLPVLPAKVVSGTTYTFSANDCAYVSAIKFTAATTITATIPSTLPKACVVNIIQGNTGQVVLQGDGTDVLYSFTGSFTSAGQWAVIGFHVESTTVVEVFGQTVNSGTSVNTTTPVPVVWDSNTTVAAGTVPILNPLWVGGGTITSVTYYTNGTGSPSFTVNVKIDGTSVTSCSAIVVNSSTVATTTCTAANTFTNTNQITLVVSAVSGTPNQALVQINMTNTLN